MKVVMVMVSTLNGKITRGEDSNIYSWTSKEDARLFSSFINKYRAIVMGGKTYEAVRHRIKLQSGKIRIVLTRNLGKYKEETVPGKLEFSSESPNELATRLENSGYKEMLLVGGGVINGLFLKSGLVDELYLTIEPRLFGNGKPLVEGSKLDIKLKLESIRRLNTQGTLHLHYKVQK